MTDQESAQNDLEFEISHLSPDDGNQYDQARTLVSGRRLSRKARARHVQALLGPNLSPPIVIDSITVGDDPACLAAEDIFSEEMQRYAQLRFVSGLNPAWGCLVIATPGSASGTPVPASAPVEKYLVRCGEFLAVNDLAHQRMPYYPQADTYEQGLAAQLAALPGGQVLPTP